VSETQPPVRNALASPSACPNLADGLVGLICSRVIAWPRISPYGVQTSSLVVSRSREICCCRLYSHSMLWYSSCHAHQAWHVTPLYFVSHACDGSGLEESGGRGSKRSVYGRFRRVRMYLLTVLALVGINAGCFLLR
jgi:hypothetical protein